MGYACQMHRCIEKSQETGIEREEDRIGKLEKQIGCIEKSQETGIERITKNR